MNKIRKVVNLYNGISCGRVALDKLGVEYDTYYSSEIDKYAMKITEDNYPDTVELGDALDWESWDIDWASVDLIMAGNPCQAFSKAGKQGGTNDPRGQLLYTTMDIINNAKKFNPNLKFFIENVGMKQEFLDLFNETIGVEGFPINSNLVSAQNRFRYYWANCELIQPEDKGVTWGDVREYRVDGEHYYYTEKALQWLAKSSQKRGKTLDIWLEDEKAQMLEASMYKNYSNQRFFGICDLPNDQQAVAAMRGRYLVDGKRQDSKGSTKGKTEQYIEFRYDGKTNCLTTVQKDNVVVPFTLPNRIPRDMFFFRYITVIEAERLQGLPDDYTKAVSKTQAYKALGNGWQVDTIEHILKHLLGDN